VVVLLKETPFRIFSLAESTSPESFYNKTDLMEENKITMEIVVYVP